MLLTYYMWIKAVKTGSIYWAAMCALAYFYMVSNSSPSSGVNLTLISLWMHSPGSRDVLFLCLCVQNCYGGGNGMGSLSQWVL